MGKKTTKTHDAAYWVILILPTSTCTLIKMKSTKCAQNLKKKYFFHTPYRLHY